MRELQGRVAVITGGGSGIGRGTARAFAGAGARVVVADVRRDRAEEVAGELAGTGAEVLGVACDVTDAGALAQLRDTTLARFGAVDVVMNNVGVIAAGPPTGIPVDEWRRVVDVNLLSVVRSNEVFLPLLVEQGAGHVVNTASTAALYPYSYDRLPYAASKGAVIALTEAIALYLKPRGVGVTLLCPGPVITNIVEQVSVHGEMSGLQGPTLEVLDADVVGGMVLDAVRNDRFLLLTHPEVHDVLVRKASDPEGFLAEQVAIVAAAEG